MVAAKTAPELRHNAVGLGPVIFQSLTVVAPAAGVATALPLATSYTGGATVLAIIFAIIVTGLMAITISQLARHLPSSGGLYTYVAHGLGPQAGFIVGWGDRSLRVYRDVLLGLLRHLVPGRDQDRLVRDP
jgi:amino acid transporter